MSLVTALLAAAAASAAPPAYLGGFCAPLALNDDASAMRAHLSQWRAKPAADSAADAARPADADAPGQLFELPDADAPTAFLDRRRGWCSLVFKSVRLPPAVASELADEALPVGDKGAPSVWRKVTRLRFGPPGPQRYFMKVGEGEGFGLCSVVYEDLRLKDGTPATLVRVATCHLAPNEKTDNG